MSRFQQVRLDEKPPMPWRNGGGTTRELLTWPNPDAWTLRISVADVCSDGPFSFFPGTRRWFCVLEGGGVELTVDGVAHRLRIGDEPFAFDGSSAVACRLLDGPTRDLNLMLRGALGSAAGILMSAAQPQQPWTPSLPISGPWGLFARVAGQLVGRDGEAPALRMPAQSLAWCEEAPGHGCRFVPDQPATSGVCGWWWQCRDLGGRA